MNTLNKTAGVKNATGRKAKAIMVGFLVTTVIAFLSLFFLFASYFFKNYHFEYRSPIVFQWPVMVVKNTQSKAPSMPKKAPMVKKAIKTTYKTDKELILSKKHGELLWKVYGLESTWGKNDGCKLKGQFNGFGYGQNTSSWNCFDDLDTVATKVSAWFDKQFNAGLSEAQALCYYNLGIKEVNCFYYQNYLKI